MANAEPTMTLSELEAQIRELQQQVARIRNAQVHSGSWVSAEAASAEREEVDSMLDGRKVSKEEIPAVEKPVEPLTTQLSDLSARAIGLFQKQSELTDKLWSYFGTYSGMAVLAALIAPILAHNNLLPSPSSFMNALYVLSGVAYGLFAYSSREAVQISQGALLRIAAQAAVASGIPLDAVKTKRALAFHRWISRLVLLTMIVGFLMAAIPAFRAMGM